jgi:hypothetical protein
MTNVARILSDGYGDKIVKCTQDMKKITWSTLLLVAQNTHLLSYQNECGLANINTV